MGSGKTTIGSILAAKKGYKFIDLDQYIVAKENASIDAIFKNKGEIYFRKVEQLYVEELLAMQETMVISLGGGTPCYGTVMETINATEDTASLYLKGSLEVLTNRLFKEKATRPLIAHLNDKEILNDFIRKHLFERSYYYNKAQNTLVIDNKTKKEIVDEALALLF